MNNTLNTPNNTDLEENFNAAMKLSEQEYDYNSLIDLLSSSKVFEKQLAALELNEIKSRNDAKILVSNLVGQDGKVREAVAFKVNNLAQNEEYADFFIDEEIFGILLEGLMDINGNVCRQIGVKWSGVFAYKFEQYLKLNLPNRIRKILNEIKDIDLKSKQYVISKRNFQLYWALEALYNIIELIDINEVKDIILFCGDFYDYTIREKISKILAKIDDINFIELKDKLAKDENYYVRRYLENIIT